MQSVLLAAFVVEGLFMYVCDRGMKTNRAQGVTDDAVRWAPLYWEKAELFTPRGNAYRRGAIVSMALMVGTLLVIALVVAE